VGFELTLGHLVGLVRREAAPATVGGEGSGGRPRRLQCRRAGELAGQCTCTGGSRGCGWRLLWRLNSSRGGGQWGAPAASDRRRCRAWRGGSELRPSRCEAGGVCGASGGAKGACTPSGSVCWAPTCWARRVATTTACAWRGPVDGSARVRVCGRKPWARPHGPTRGPRRDGVRTAGDVGPARGTSAVPTARRCARSALRRSSPFSIHCTPH
jgi:hypothetical protein